MAEPTFHLEPIALREEWLRARADRFRPATDEESAFSSPARKSSDQLFLSLGALRRGWAAEHALSQAAQDHHLFLNEELREAFC